MVSSEVSRFVPANPRGQLATLDDARARLLKLPKIVHDSAGWQAAIEAVLLVGTAGGPSDFARIGLMQALYPKGEPVFDPSRKDPTWRRQKLARDR